jgi:23S rRNA (uracil1939-C5)-methyltransferase
VKGRAKLRPAATPQISKVDDLSQEGRGIAHHEGKAVFIDDALPGERVQWSLRKRARNFDEGRLESVLEPSPERVVPRCRHFGICGGCVLQHLDSAAQIAFKERQMLEALARIGGVEPQSVLPPLRGEPWHYRRRARLGARWVAKKNRAVVGFRERSAPYLADLERCEVLEASVSDLPGALGRLVSALSIRERVPQIEVAVAESTTALVIRVLLPPSAADLELITQFAAEHGVQIHLQPGGYDSVTLLAGSAEPLSYRLPKFDIELHFAPTDFVQINTRLNELMVERAVELLQPEGHERVLDLFCGMGNFSLPLARRAAHVVGIEGDAGLIAAARANAARNGLANTEFCTSDLTQPDLANVPWARQIYHKVLLDPPRAGAREVLPLIAATAARRIVYVSCHPGTFARDAGILVSELGFQLRSAGVMDMFPHTAHVESMAVFER